MNNHKKTQQNINEIDLLPAPKEEMGRRLKLIELLTDTERDMLRGFRFEQDHYRLFASKRGRGFHNFD